MTKVTDLLKRIERLEWVIDTLQTALGWVVSVERINKDAKQYSVHLNFSITLSGKAWPMAFFNRDYFAAVAAMVEHRLYQLWDKEREIAARGDVSPRTISIHKTK